MSATYERKLVNWLNDRGWVATRTAGSMGEADIIAISPESTVIIEVKKTGNEDKKNVWTGGNKEQWEHYVDMYSRGFDVVYAVRFTTGSQDGRWRIYPIEDQLGKKYPNVLRRREGVVREEYFSGS